MSTSSSTVVGGDYNEEKDQQLEEDQQRQWLLDTIATTGGLNNNNIDLSLLIKLDLPNCGIKTLPSCLPNICPNLSILFLSKNNFLEVPAVIGQCLKLQMISFKECYTIESIHPESLQKQLRWLILTGNKIKFIPSTISRCTKLQKLMLSGNLLECLPEQSMLKLHNLELIRLACNQLTDPPIILLQNLQNLKWCAFAGNPFLYNMKMKNVNTSSASVVTKEFEQLLPVLDDPILDDDSWPILGQGAGGVTRKVTWNNNKNNNNTHKIVAVKTFAGELTSDGSPQDEKDISKLVSTSASSASSSSSSSTSTATATATATTEKKESALIEILGETKINGALVMEYLDNYKALADPPNFDTCSRDVYSSDDDINNSLTKSKSKSNAIFAWKIVIDTLRVLSKLHNLGICHADFYAHNILIQLETNQVKLSDFGAAFRYRYNNNNNNDNDNDNDNYDNNEFGQLVQIIELRAYAVLVTELYNLTMNNNNNSNDNNNNTNNNNHSSPQWKELLEELQKPNITTFDALVEKFIV